MSGLSRTPGKRVRVNSPPRVRIPPSPPIINSKENKTSPLGWFFISTLLFFSVVRFEPSTHSVRDRVIGRGHGRASSEAKAHAKNN